MSRSLYDLSPESTSRAAEYHFEDCSGSSVVIAAGFYPTIVYIAQYPSQPTIEDSSTL